MSAPPVSVVIATCGDTRWAELAQARAVPSVIGQAPFVAAHFGPPYDVSTARNTAAAGASSTPWGLLVFLDADDELEPGYVAAMQRAAADCGESWRLRLFVPRVRYVQPDGTAEEPLFPNRGSWPRRNECVIGTAVAAVTFTWLGGFRSLPSLEDYDLFLRAYDRGCQLVPVPDAIYRAHVSPGSRNGDQSPYAGIWAEHLRRM